MPAIPALIAAGGAIASAKMSADAQKKAAKIGAEATAAGQIDIDKLDEKTRSMAQRNALESAELERQLTPEVPQIRQSANKALLNDINSPNESDAVGAFLGNRIMNRGDGAMSPLLMAAVQRAKSNLDLGGQLDVDTRNEVTRKSLARSGTVGGGLGLGRDITARDLGLTSLQLQNQRLGQASQLGGQEQSALQFNEGNLLDQLQLLRALGDTRFQRNLAAAQFGESIQRPVVGLDPGSVADIYAGNSNNRQAGLANQANISGQQSQNMMGLAGQLAGYGLQSYANSKNQQPVYSTYGGGSTSTPNVSGGWSY